MDNFLILIIKTQNMRREGRGDKGGGDKDGKRSEAKKYKLRQES